MRPSCPLGARPEPTTAFLISRGVYSPHGTDRSARQSRITPLASATGSAVFTFFAR